jgi:hypothetical protein
MARRGGGEDDRVTLRLLLVDEGQYHHEEIRIPSAWLARYDRLIDLLQEDPEFLRSNYVDLERLCSARVLDDASDS